MQGEWIGLSVGPLFSMDTQLSFLIAVRRLES
jgi:hypothetical protein